MINFKKNRFCICCCAVILCALMPLTSCTKKLKTQALSLKKNDGTEIQITAEMARTEKERNNGYMYRKNIPDGTGMLFLFDRDQMLSFWMKNTPHPLSIAFIDSLGRIRDIFDMTPYSIANINSTVNVRYALEVPQGWFTRTGIKTGDILVLNFDPKAE
ncbi:MAG: DUF192 domain-containing protein [Treponema sp.]|nr:DUF192 domain-containing protein [Treponema sp.]